MDVYTNVSKVGATRESSSTDNSIIFDKKLNIVDKADFLNDYVL